MPVDIIRRLPTPCFSIYTMLSVIMFLMALLWSHNTILRAEETLNFEGVDVAAETWPAVAAGPSQQQQRDPLQQLPQEFIEEALKAGGVEEVISKDGWQQSQRSSKWEEFETRQHEKGVFNDLCVCVLVC